VLQRFKNGLRINAQPDRGDNNTAAGSFALIANTTGIANTANGWYSLYSNTTGSQNTANGVYALYSDPGHSCTMNKHEELGY
jgi:hypothetical protein